MTPTPAADPRRKAKTLSYFATFIALGLTSAALGPTLPALAEKTNVTLASISAIFVARSLGYLLGSLWGGRWYDRVPGHPVMGIALLGMAAMMFLAPLMPLLWLLIGILLLLGLAESTLDVGGNTLLVWVHGDEVGPAMNGLHFFFGAGAFLSPIIIAQAILLSDNIAWAFWALGLLILPVALRMLLLASPAMPAPAQDQAKTGSNTVLVALLALFFFLHVGAESAFGNWIFTYATRSNLLDQTAAAYATSAFWGALTVGRLLAIPLVARLRPALVLLSDLLGLLASILLLLLFPDSALAVWAGAIGAGLSIASLFPTSMSFAQRRMPITGAVTGWFFAGASLGGMSIPWLIGQFIETAGPGAMPVILAGVSLLILAVFALLVRYRKPETA